MNLRPLAVWLMIIAAECVHGILRELFLEVPFGDRLTHQIGVLVGSLLAFSITLSMIRWMRVQRTSVLVLVGAGWASLTFIFDAGLGSVLVDRSFPSCWPTTICAAAD